MDGWIQIQNSEYRVAREDDLSVPDYVGDEENIFVATYGRG